MRSRTFDLEGRMAFPDFVLKVSEPVPGHFTYQYQGGNPVRIGPFDTGTMLDWKGPRYAVKSCDHTRLRCVPDGPTSAIIGGQVHESLGFDNAMFWIYQGKPRQPTQTSISTTSSFAGPDWFALIHDLNEQLEKNSPREFFLAEMLIEYKIFADALKLLINPSRGIKSLLTLGKRLSFDGPLGKMRTISKNTSKAYLGYSFGVKPALNDIASLFSAHDRVHKRMKYFRENAGKWTSVSSRMVIPSNVSHTAWPAVTFSQLLRLKTEEKFVLAVASCQAKVKRYFSAQDVWQAYYEYFALGDVIQLGWELIPFSFVLDWFTNTQERIDDCLRPFRLSAPFTHVKDFCFSKKEVHHQKLYCSWGDKSGFGNWALDDWTPFCDYYTERYQRFTSVPETSGVVDLSTLGLFHKITSGALVLSKLR